MSGEQRQRLFGTDGVRGVANEHPMTAEIALALGQAVAHVFGESGVGRPRIIIGKDTRLSGYMFENALVSGICSMGVDVLQVGPMPTPGLAFLTADMRCHAGVMISASHNPFRDNGIKFFSNDGFKLPDDVEARIEGLVASGELAGQRAPSDAIGQATRIDDAEGRYVVFLKKTFPRDLTLDGLRVVLDCANGAAYKVAPTVLRELGAEVFCIGVEPDGRNINENCGAIFPEKLGERVLEARADLGIALDGDADRCLLIDEKGHPVDGDALLALLAEDLHKRGELRGGGVVSTVMSNLGLESSLERHGLRLSRTAVGDRYVVERMREGGYNLGGEQSGHVIFLDHNTTGDGLITALQSLAIVTRSALPLSQLSGDFRRFPQVLLNIEVSENRPIEEIPELQALIARIEGELGGEGRVLIRYSGTEAKVRVMVEGPTEKRVSAYAAELAEAIRGLLGGR